MPNLANLKKISKANSQPSNYELRYSAKQEKFKIGNDLWSRLDLDNNGLTAFLDTENNKVYIGVGTEEQSVLLKRRKDSKSKTHEFTSRELRRQMDQVGMKAVDMEFVDTGEVFGEGPDAMRLYEVVPAEGASDYDEDEEAEQESTQTASIV